MKKSVKYILAAVVALAVVVAVVMQILAPMGVAVVAVAPRTAQTYFVEQGFVRDDRAIDVFALVGGRILSVDVAEGQRVSEGDVIARVYTCDIAHEIEQIRLNNTALSAQIGNLSAQERRTRDEQLAALGSLRGEYEAILAQQATARTAQTDQYRIREENIRLQNILVSQSRNDVTAAEAEMQNFTRLFEAGAVSRQELERAERGLLAAQAQLETNLQTLEIVSGEAAADQSEYFAGIRSSLRAQISGIERQIAGSHTGPMVEYYNTLIQSGDLTIASLQRRIDDSVITSPVSGIITDLYVDNINVLNIAHPVARISTDREVPMVEVYVSTLDIGDIRIGDYVDLTLRRQRGDLIYPGRVYAIGDRAEVRISTLGVEERRVQVLIEAYTAAILGGSFMAGFDVDVRFITYSEEDQLMVPKTAVFRQFDVPSIPESASHPQDMVFVVENGVAHARPVVLSRELRVEHVVASGLYPGDIVVRDASIDGLRDGVRVSGE